MIISLRIVSFIFAILGILFFLIFKNKDSDVKLYLDSKQNSINFFLISFWLNLILSIFSALENRLYYGGKGLLFFSITTFIIAVISIIFVLFYEDIKDKIVNFLYKKTFLNMKYIDVFNIVWIILFLFFTFQIS